ncbi:unnamed protein product [Schistosoma haematobium]|nr:unnamed protein product [Schistosoma haematobium]
MVITIIDFTSFQLPKYSFYKRFLFTIIHNTTNKHTTYNHDSNHIYFQQNFAYIALIHSIPWALAAGTSLLIAFLFQTPIHSNSLIINKSIFNHSQYTWMESIKSNHINLLFNGLHSLLTCSMKRTTSLSASLSSTSTSMNPDVMTTNTSTWISSILLIIIPLLLQMMMIILFIILLYMIISYINHRNCIIYKLKLPNQSIVLIILILLIELISLCIPIVYYFIMTYYSINDKQLLFITRIIILHFCIDPILLIYIIQKCLSNKHILMLSNKFNIIHMKSIKNNKNNQLIDYHSLECINNNNNNNNDNNEMKPLTSPIHLFNCLPMHHSNTITTTTYTTTNTTYNSNNNIQSVVMPYLTDSGYFVSTINNHNNNDNHSLITSSIINNDKINMNNYILPITTDTIEVTMPNIYPNNNINNSSITSSSNNNIHLKDSSLLTPVTEMNNHNTLIYKNMHDAYPQLCQHHQRLLAEQYKQPIMDTIKRNRHFTNVPRMNQTVTTTHFNALSLNKSINECSNNNNNTIPHIMNEMVCTQQHSTATAAVMAAAAAAVAAQASTLTKPIHSLLDSIQMTPNPLLFINEQKTIEQTISNDNQ